MNNISSDEIPKTIQYLNECLDDIAQDFNIIVSYSYYNPINIVSRSYVHKNEDSDYRYNINISKENSKDSKFILFKCRYNNDKYQTEFLYDDTFAIKNTGITLTIDEILLEALVFVNRKRISYLD